MYTCPQCKIGLSKQRGNPGVFWSCPSCSGRSATVALLRNNVPGSVVNELWQAARAGSYPRKRACPACSKQMAEVPASGAHGVEYVDVCTVCQFIWFDFGEYDALPVTPQNLSLENKLSSDVKKEVAYHQIKALQKEAHGSDWGQSTTPENWWQWIPGFLGMPVEEDVSCRRIPWVTWILTLMVTTASLIAFLDFNYVAETLGLIPAEADRYGGGTLLTSFFIHGGLLHLIGNMYFFLVFGDNVEERLGICRYAFLLLSATLC
ncbi:MAG: rhomboid family intramembrane serine protease, partial [Kiritimatiellaceae bacterium]|nr:rhomboid family intramembrane serine protease [Kiritimatiellaceae bacterium]